MWNAGLEKSQAGIKIAGKNINSLRYANNTSLMAESEKELKSLLIRVKEEWKSWLETQHYKSKIRASGPNSSQQREGGKVETMTDFIFLGSQITADNNYSCEIKIHLVIGRKAMINHIKKQSHHFAYKDLSSQSYVFLSSHVQMWELGHEKGECQRIDVSELWYLRRLLRVLGQQDQTSQS